MARARETLEAPTPNVRLVRENLGATLLGRRPAAVDEQAGAVDVGRRWARRGTRGGRDVVDSADATGGGRGEHPALVLG